MGGFSRNEYRALYEERFLIFSYWGNRWKIYDFAKLWIIFWVRLKKPEWSWKSCCRCHHRKNLYCDVEITVIKRVKKCTTLLKKNFNLSTLIKSRSFSNEAFNSIIASSKTREYLENFLIKILKRFSSNLLLFLKAMRFSIFPLLITRLREKFSISIEGFYLPRNPSRADNKTALNLAVGKY